MIKFSLSIVIPVYNESAIINNTVDHLQNLFAPLECLEIIVVDGSPQQNTIESIKDSSVIKIVSPKGRGSQMKAGARLASGNILLFLHADTVLDDNAFDYIVQTAKERNVVGGAFNLGIQSDKPIFRLIERVVAMRTRITKIPYGDQVIFLKRHFFKKVGGFKDIPIMEDVDLMRRVKKSGCKFKIIKQQVRTSSRRWEREGIIFCTIRNTILLTLYLAGVSPSKLIKYYP